MILLPNLHIWTIINHARDISRRQLTDKVFPHRRQDWLFAKPNRLSRRNFRIDARRIDLRQDFDTAVGVAISGKAPDAVASMKRSGPFKAGVIDAAKVTRSALQNAASIAALFLTTEAVIVDKPEDKAPAMPGGGGMDDF